MRQYVITYSRDDLTYFSVYQETYHGNDKAALESALKRLKESTNYSLISVKVNYL